MFMIQIQGDTSPGEPGLGWLRFWLFHPLPGSAWVDGKLAELAEQLCKMEEHPKSKSTKTRCHPVIYHHEFIINRCPHAIYLSWTLASCFFQIPFEFSKHIMKTTGVVELSNNPWKCTCASQVTDLVRICNYASLLLGDFLQLDIFNAPTESHQQNRRQEQDEMWSRVRLGGER